MTSSTPRFSGTYREFHVFIGPYLRNLVQNFARGPKAAANSCQHCGETAPLDAAHRDGRGRTEIVRLLVEPEDDDARITVDLQDFVARFKAAHEPIEEAFLFLCRSCHIRYDNSTGPNVRPGRGASASHLAGGALPISLFPEDPGAFKHALLDRRVAYMEISYVDGRVETRRWNANRFSTSSNVYGNLRSRPEFRSGVWQASGIASLHVRVDDRR